MLAEQNMQPYKFNIFHSRHHPSQRVVKMILLQTQGDTSFQAKFYEPTKDNSQEIIFLIDKNLICESPKYFILFEKLAFKTYSA